MRTRIKICGITRAEDLACAVQEGADAIGMVFYQKSPRFLALEQARSLRLQVPPFVDVVALFVNPDPSWVREVQAQVQPDLLQFHGDEKPEFCEAFDARFLKALRVGAPSLDTPAGLLNECRRFGSASGWLFDSFTPEYGGSGKTFDYRLLADVMQHPEARPLILSGGLGGPDMADKLRQVRPFAVDVSSGVEERPGIKSADKIRAFVQAVRSSD